MTNPTSAETPPPQQKQQQLPTAIEFEPPLACVRRILKNTLPASTNVGKDASAAFARSAGIFIIYLTACANDFARESRRQTITANDVLAAVKELDFDEFTPKLTEFLEGYRAQEKRKKDAKAQAAAAKAQAAETETPVDEVNTTPQSKASTNKEDETADTRKQDDESTEEEGEDPATEEEDGAGDDEEEDDNNDNDEDNNGGGDENNDSNKKRKREADDDAGPEYQD